ncbi:MAG: excinuclease ABC subunit UvrC [Spirochaetaceae bacterium]|jgi:excinuclease ABC subunit C|nr:excinuclease ABC subunit UvrC [Spirochaetaceae bacterium]
MNPTGFSENYEALKISAQEAPGEPGVYLWRDDENHIIYIGKAKSLRNRLTSYFAKTQDLKTKALLKHAKSIETIITLSEYEALLLEHTLIQQYYPKYNINLKDGKTYPMIRITAEAFPRVFKTRHILKDDSQYFGPYPHAGAVDALLELIGKMFLLRKCRVLRKRDSPCVYYHIGRCGAPCCKKISAEDYGKQVLQIRRLLSGETEPLILDWTALMHEEARNLRFERAALIRDAVKAIEELSETSTVIDRDPDGRDYIAYAAEGVYTTFTVFSMREGKLVGRELFRTHSAAEEEESLETFIAAYYTQNRPPPQYIYLHQEKFMQAMQKTQADIKETQKADTKKIQEEKETQKADTKKMQEEKETQKADTKKMQEEKEIQEADIKKWFLKRFGYEPFLLLPKEKRHAAVLAMARQNAQEDLRRRLKDRGAGPALDELVRVLRLRNRPERIEGFDIAQLAGKHPAASLVSFKNGVPDRKNYRYFKLRTVIGVVDDFAAVREAVRRRYVRVLREGKELPDLILIDGGIGQVRAAKGVLGELGLDLDVAGLAKRDEELWLPDRSEPIRLSKRSEALKVLQFVRDESHRFATALNQRLRAEDIGFQVLESVEGVGPKRAEALMRSFGELPRIAGAAIADLIQQGKLNEATARAVKTAAVLAIEDQRAGSERLTRAYSAESPGESLAAEAAEEYSP